MSALQLVLPKSRHSRAGAVNSDADPGSREVEHMRRRTYVSSHILFPFFLFSAVAFGDGSVAIVPKSAATDNCYTFSVTNHVSGKQITDLHFSAGGTKVPGEHTRVPTNWDATNDANGDLVFQTPPASTAASGGTASTTPTNPIGTNKKLGGFRFCLPKQMMLSFTISYSDATSTSPSKFGTVQVGGVVTHNYTLTCIKVKITAPADIAVWDVHLGGVGKSHAFDEISLPSGWSGSISSDGTGVDIGTGNTPLAPGATAEIGLCFRDPPASITWKLTDKDHKDIPGASGQAKKP